MVDEPIFKQSPFAKKPDDRNHSQAEGNAHEALVLRSGFAAPPDKDKTPGKASEKPETRANSDRTARPTDTAPDRASSNSIPETKSIYEVQKIFAQVKELQSQMLQSCYEKQPNGDFKLRTGKIPDGKGGMVEVEAVQGHFIAQMSDKFEQAVKVADASMKNPDSVFGATMSARKQLESASQESSKIQKELADQGINTAVGGYVDKILVGRFLEEHKDLSPEQKKQVESLRTALDKKEKLETQFRDLKIMQDTPVVTRQSYAEFLRNAGLPNASDAWAKDAMKVAEQLNSPAGRSEFMKKQMDAARQEKDNSLDKTIQEKYLKPVQEIENLMANAKERVAKGDLAGARQDMEQVRSKAGSMPTVDQKDVERLQAERDDFLKDNARLQEKLKNGTATPNDIRLQQERELKIVNEAQVLDAVRLAKPRADMAFADFLLNADKDKNSEANRKAARDILLSMRFDATGKIAASQMAEQFDALTEKAINGSDSNRASMIAYNKVMQEHDALKQKAATAKDDSEIAKLLQEARAKAEQGIKIAGSINRDAADENQKSVKQQLQKQIEAEKAKPASEQDQGKIKLMQAIMKPPSEQSAEEKKLVSSLSELAKGEKANKAELDKLSGMVKDKSALFDAFSSYAMLQQLDFQKQAVNNARLAALDLDIAMGKGENNPLIKDIEHDKYGREMISTLNSLPGQEGRTLWGDMKEATRDLAWYESAWKWTKGTLKEVAISLASWGVGITAGLGAAALFSWSGPGAVVGGAAVGFAAGAATGSALRYALGDKVTLTSAALDGLSGMTGGLTGTSYALARGAGSAAIKNVIANQAERGVTIGANQTWTAFKAAGMADKFRIAAGGNPFLATFSASTAGSIAYRYPSEALLGNYASVGDWAAGSTGKVVRDIPQNLVGSYFGARIGAPAETKVLQSGGSFFDSASRQMTKSFLWTVPDMWNRVGHPQRFANRSEFNAPLYDLLEGKPDENE